MDLVNMEKLKIKYKVKVFKYVLLVMDVFSWYWCLVFLEWKLSFYVVCELLCIYRENGVLCGI